MAVCKPDFHSSDFHSSDFSTTINETVFNRFITDKLPEYFRRNDTYKDKNNEGLLIRFLSIFGDEIDQEIMPTIECYLNIIDAQNCDPKYLTHLSDVLGNPPDIFGDDDIYRNLLSYICSVYKIKGTKTAYELFFSLLGFTIDLVEIEPNKNIFNYDVNGMYDDGIIYDSNPCEGCSYYDITFYPKDYTNYTFTQDLIAKLRAAIKFNEPINAKLRYLTLGVKIDDTINININESDITTINDNVVLYDIGNNYDDSNSYDVSVIIVLPILLQTKMHIEVEEIDNYWKIKSTLIKNFIGDINILSSNFNLVAKLNGNEVYNVNGKLLNTFTSDWKIKSSLIKNSHYIPDFNNLRLTGYLVLENGMKANINTLLNVGSNTINIYLS